MPARCHHVSMSQGGGISTDSCQPAPVACHGPWGQGPRLVRSSPGCDKCHGVILQWLNRGWVPKKGLGTKKEETPNFFLHNYAGSRDWLTCAYSVPGSDSEQQERLLHTTPRWHSSQDGAEQPIKRGAGSSQGMAQARDHQVGGCCKNN